MEGFLCFNMKGDVRFMDDNDVFMAMTNASRNAKRQRIKGYYICRDCGEFIKTIPRKQVSCPFCGQMAKLIMHLSPIQEQTTIGIWKSAGYYSDIRADIERKEKTA